MKHRSLIIVALFVALLIGAWFPLRLVDAQFIDRIVRPCTGGAVVLASVIVNPSGNGNVNVVPCTGGSLTVNGVPVVPGGLPDPGSNGIVVRTAASTDVARTITVTAATGLSVTNGNGVAGNPVLAGIDAVADGATKGVSAYTATDFDAAAGIISLDYTNGQKASAVVPGFLSSADWTTFNSKQAAGSYITALTGDGTAAGPGSVALTLATVNANVGSFGSATQSLSLTANGKGLITAVSAQTVTPAVGSITGLGANVATWLVTPSSANLRAALTDENGTGPDLFDGATSPTFTTSVIAPTFTNTAALAITTTAGNGNITMTPNGTGSVISSGPFGVQSGTTLLTGGADIRYPFTGFGSAVAAVLAVTANTTNGAMSNGFGPAVGFYIKDNVAGPNLIGYISAIMTNASKTTGKMIFTVENAGVANDALTLDNLGNLTLNTAARTFSAPTYTTATNCSSSAAPAVCSSAAAGSVVVAAAGTTVVVNTTAVTANSQIFVTYDSSLGTKLGVTCNTTEPALYGVTARTAATSFTITSTAPVTNPACFSYWIVN